MKKKLTYKDSGVDIKKADEFICAIKGLVKSTRKPGVMDKTRAFGSLFELGKFKQPVLVSSTDGVGTKLLVAQAAGRFDTVGIDCVAMNVNDVLCVGARPVALVDYIAVEEATPALLGAVGEGLARGCEQAGVSCPGGELAQVREMLRGVAGPPSR